MVKYDNILKAIEDYTVKCKVTLKSVKEAIGPILEGWARDGENGIDVEWAMDIISHFYRDEYNAQKGKVFIMRDDGSRSEIVNTDDRRDFPSNTETPENYSVTNALLIRSDPKGTALPSNFDIRQQIESQSTLGVLINNGGITLTYNKGQSQSNVNVNSPLYNRDKWLSDQFWTDRDTNGVQKTWEQMKAGKISHEEANAQLKKHYVKDTNGVRSKAGTNRVNRDYMDKNVPIETQYVEIEKYH